ncbi:MAG TPA: ABC transporter ATP-binding protein [Microbacteriaceae bacterium]|nr:ABC transporter ATP-binding protein [Microbacteriaceae bacterium]
MSKRFVLRKDNSLKERIVGFGRVGRRHREDFWVLRDVNITIRAGETIGLIGHNGSGKSTLLKLIGGILDPTKGKVEHRGRIAALLELGAGFHPDLTGRENVYLNAALMGLSREETDARFGDITAFADIGEFIDTQVKFYSSGMFVRLAFAVAINTDPDILLVDEVLAVGDEAFQRKCLDKIAEFKAQGVTIIIVSHRLAEIQGLCERVLLLDHGQVVHDGDTREGIRALRNLLKAASPNPDGDHIVDVAVLDGQGQPRATFQPGEDVLVRIELDRLAALRGWYCSIQVDDAFGRIAFGTSTYEIDGGAWFGSTEDRMIVTFRISAPALADGRFFVNCAIILREPLNMHADDAMQAATFEVASDETPRGLIRIVASAEIETR